MRENACETLRERKRGVLCWRVLASHKQMTLREYKYNNKSFCVRRYNCNVYFDSFFLPRNYLKFGKSSNL